MGALVLAVLAVGTAAAAPEGARLAVVVARPHPNAGTEVLAMGPAGEARERLIGGPGSSGGPTVYTAPTWSADGSLLAWVGSVRGGLGVYVSSADGSDVRLVRATVHLPSLAFADGAPVFAPDGDLVFPVIKLTRGHFQRSSGRGSSEGTLVVASALWSAPVAGSRAHRVTPWLRNRSIAPAGFAADGTLVATLVGRRGSRLVAMDLAGGEVRTLARNGLSPAVSPDGSQIAFLRNRFRGKTSLGEPRLARTDLFTMPIAGGRARLVTRIKGGAGWPSWDPSGQRLALTGRRGVDFRQPVSLGQGNSLLEVNADGTCLTRIFGTKRAIVSGAAWQPGPGREAGPISC